MNTDPLSVALHEIAETKRLVQTLIISSESFDYPKAKLVLKELERKVRDLGKIQSRLEVRRFGFSDPKICHVDFGVNGQ